MVTEGGARFSGKTKRRACVVLCIALLAGGMALTFSRVLTADPSEISGRYDVYRYYGPAAYFLDVSLHDGTLPLWNSLTYCGVPHAANPQSFVFYPPNLMRSLLTPAPTPYKTQAGLVALIGLHLLLAGVSTYLLARDHGQSLGGAFTAAVVFTFSAIMVRRACEYHFLFTLGWLPLALLMLKKMLDADRFGRSLYFGLAAGLVLGISILGGFLQIVNYMGVTMAGYAILYRILNTRRGDDGSLNTGFGAWMGDGAVLGLVFILGGLIASVLLLPVMELAAYTSRQGGAPVPLYSNLWEWTIGRFYQSTVVYAGMKYEAETLRGPGVCALLLAVAGLTHARRRDVILFSILVFVLVECSLGPNVPMGAIVDWLTPFSQSAYSRGIDFALLPLGLLAGFGVDAISKTLGNWRLSVVRALLLLYVGLAMLVPLAFWVNPHPYLPVSNVVVALPAAGLLLMLFAGTVPLPGAARILVCLAMPLLVFGETYAWNQHYVPWMIKKQFREGAAPEEKTATFPLANTRGTDVIANRALYSMAPAMNGVDPMHFARVRDLISGQPRDKQARRLVTNWEPTAENHRGNLFLKRFFWLAERYVEGPLPGKQDLFPSATTVFLQDVPELPVPKVDRAEVPHTSISDDFIQIPVNGEKTLLRPSTKGRQVSHTITFELPAGPGNAGGGPAGAVHSALFMGYTSSGEVQVDTRFAEPDSGRHEWGKRHRVVSTNGQEKVIEVPVPDFRSVQVSIRVIPAKPSTSFQFTKAFVRCDQRDADSLLRIDSLGANSVDLEVGPLDGPRILTFLDANYPGWKAYVDSSEVLLYAANDVFKAIVVPSGTHKVRFEFAPPRIYIGALISLAAGLAALGGLLLLRRRSAGAENPQQA